jgi:hypothetical protein
MDANDIVREIEAAILAVFARYDGEFQIEIDRHHHADVGEAGLDIWVWRESPCETEDDG